jgi:hypothetical protein
MSKANDNKSKSELHFEWAEKWVPIIALGCFVLILIAYFYRPFDGFGSNNDFGTFGDFLGGALNPILGFATVYLLIQSIRFQIDELRHTREDIQISREELKQSNIIHQSNLNTLREKSETEHLLKEIQTAQNYIDRIYSSVIKKGGIKIGAEMNFEYIFFTRDALFSFSRDSQAKNELNYQLQKLLTTTMLVYGLLKNSHQNQTNPILISLHLFSFLPYFEKLSAHIETNLKLDDFPHLNSGYISKIQNYSKLVISTINDILSRTPNPD